jgi:hypothetical protein
MKKIEMQNRKTMLEDLMQKGTKKFNSKRAK